MCLTQIRLGNSSRYETNAKLYKVPVLYSSSVLIVQQLSAVQLYSRVHVGNVLLVGIV